MNSLERGRSKFMCIQFKVYFLISANDKRCFNSNGYEKHELLKRNCPVSSIATYARVLRIRFIKVNHNNRINVTNNFRYENI